MAQRNWHVREYRQGDEFQILRLFEKVFRHERTIGHWRWKFEQNPAGRQITIAVTDDQSVVGHFAGLPAFATTPAKSLVISQGIDHMVDQEWRRRGIYRAMAREFFQDESIASWYAFPDKKAFQIEAKAFGASTLHPVLTIRCDLTKPECWRSQPKSFRIERLDRVDGSIDQLWNLCRPQFPLATKRDSGYLNWRYAECPDTEYTFLVARGNNDGRTLGLAVMRFGRFDLPIASIVDWLVPVREKEVELSLLASCHDLARAKKLTATQASFPSYTPQYEFFTSLGYQVVGRRLPRYQVVASVRGSGGPEAVKALMKGWYYTMGDSDMF